MPLPQFNVESNSGGEPLPLEAMPASGGTAAAFKEGVAGSLYASVITGIKGATGDQTFVPRTDAEKEMRQNGYDPSVLPQNGLTRGYLDALKEQQSALKRNQQIADSAGLMHSAGIAPSWRGMAEFVGGSAADSPFFMLGGGAAGLGARSIGAAGLEGAAGFGVRAAEGAAVAGAYDVGRKEVGTVPGDKDLGLYDFTRDMAIGGALGSVLGPRNAAERNLVNNNPGNMRVPGKMDWQRFGSLDEGIAAVGNQINRYRSRGLNTIQKIVETYAPAKDHNNVEAYVADVAKKSGVDPNTPISDAQVAAVRDAMIDHEQGPGWRDKAERFRTNPAKIADEHAAEVSGIETDAFHNAQAKLTMATADAMNDKVPDGFAPDAGTKPVWETPEATAQLDRMAQQPKAPTVTPETEQLNQSATDAVKDAEHATQMANSEADTTALQEHLKQAQEAAQPQADVQKAIAAAVKCAAVKGFG